MKEDKKQFDRLLVDSLENPAHINPETTYYDEKYKSALIDCLKKRNLYSSFKKRELPENSRNPHMLSIASSSRLCYLYFQEKNILFEKFLDEIEAFFSGDEKYEQERLSILGEKGAVQTYVISSISIALAPYFQTSSVFLAPVVSITLFSITKMGINAWLSMRKEQKNKLDSVSKD